MTENKLTSAGEVACYLAAHLVSILAAYFWLPYLFVTVREKYGASALGLVLPLNTVGTILIVLVLFLLLRQAMTQSEPRDGRLTTAPEVGAYLLAHVIGYVINAAWTPFVVRYLRDPQNPGAAGIMPLTLLNALAVIVVVMFLFFLMRKHMPRFNRVWFAMSGRSSRYEYWVYYVLPLYAVLAVMTLAHTLPPTSMLTQVAASTWLWLLLMLWPALAVGIKRSHDRNRSAWFLLIGFIPIVGAIWLLVELAFLRGTVGANRFGPDPVGGGVQLPSAATPSVTSASTSASP